jgi:hypothetical protein
VKTKAIVAGGVLLLFLLFIAILLSGPHKPPQDITVRHVKSIQSSNITTMTFEIKNHTATPYIFFPFEVQIRNGNAWTRLQGFDMQTIHPPPKIDVRSLASYTINVTNVPSGSVVRFSIRPQKILLGVNGFVRRAELKLEHHGASSIPLNPNDRNSQVYGSPTEVVSDGFAEKSP